MGLILAQSGKGAGLDSNLGGVAQNVFGGQAASQFLKKWTRIFFGLFIVLCILLAVAVKKADGTTASKHKAIDKIKKEQQQKTGGKVPVSPVAPK